MQASHEIQVNGEPVTVPVGSTVADLVDQLALAGRKIAVAVNRDVVPKSRFGRQRIESADRVEILEAVGGG